jgi:hypothetical protein
VTLLAIALSAHISIAGNRTYICKYKVSPPYNEKLILLKFNTDEESTLISKNNGTNEIYKIYSQEIFPAKIVLNDTFFDAFVSRVGDKNNSTIASFLIETYPQIIKIDDFDGIMTMHYYDSMGFSYEGRCELK